MITFLVCLAIFLVGLAGWCEVVKDRRAELDMQRKLDQVFENQAELRRRIQRSTLNINSAAERNNLKEREDVATR